MTTTRRFPFRIGPRSRTMLRLVFGVTPDTAWVDLGSQLDVRFGRARLETPVENIVRWQIEGPWRWITAIGIRRSLRGGDFTFGSTSRGGVRIDFREPLAFGPFHPPALYVTVDDLEGLAAALAELGIPGRDARTRVLP